MLQKKGYYDQNLSRETKTRCKFLNNRFFIYFKTNFIFFSIAFNRLFV